MSSAPVNPLEVPPYQVQSLISGVADAFGLPSTIQFVAQLQSYQILSHQTLPSNKPIEEIALIPSISRALVYSDRQIHFYTLPSLDPVPHTIIKPIRNVVTFAIDHQHLRRPPPSTEPVEFCVIKRSSIALYNILERLTYQKEIPLPHPVFLARRFGRALCVADQHTYSIVDLEDASIFPLMPICQTESATQLRPSINVVSDNEFLITSFAEGGTLGVFITGEGIPLRGTLQWPSYPRSVCLDYPYVASLLPNDTIEIHNVDTQSIAQVIPAPSDSSPTLHPWLKLISCSNGYLVPSAQRSDKMGLTSVRLFRA
ncbi:hypothetical protein CCMSSC00406_0006715 [Pleurotus cornucopiae]|uniref:Uncharacterized protein n=1 Tax=Pleurotus cornucopiae TaxID=5321 RepID=A0ACB7IU20_PLECO|nr:hypothetical protein CCMSSC00406_0006715 [Pleurotus cornucopiae]